ncbi:MAG TPA: SH3 domain-containing protein [Phototrophicaceae bacterium]|nr:SH3 domain-containing protein [Phototrophicaceae bacterium]
MRKIRQWLMGLMLITLLTYSVQAEDAQQVAISPTPVPINLPSPIPFGAATQGGATTPTATFTPTAVGPVLLEAKTEANIRSSADPEADLLGTIRAGDLYPVIGRYYRWYQFQYDTSPTGTGWVFDELVNLVGDTTTIIDLSAQAAPTTDATAVAATALFEAITQTPGGILTVTAQARVISIPELSQPGQADTAANTSGIENTVASPNAPVLLPTFTFPPNLIPATPTPAQALAVTATTVESTGTLPLPTSLPPIVPVLILGGIGILGLAVSSFRR